MDAIESFMNSEYAGRRYQFDAAAGFLGCYTPVLVRQDGDYLATAFSVGDDWYWAVWREGQALAGHCTLDGTPEAACAEALRAIAVRKEYDSEQEPPR